MSGCIHNVKEGGNARAGDTHKSKTRYMTAPGKTPAQNYLPMNLLNSLVCVVKCRNPTGNHASTNIYFQIRLLLQTP